jgi:hypothetical protein
MLKTQELFKLFGWQYACKFLSEQFFIICKEYDNHVVLNYNQIFSPEVNDYVMECRGLILDKHGEVAGRRWTRFFNYGQQPDITGQFVFEDSEIFEKVDGSTILVWYNTYDKKWEISTRGTAFGESGQNFYPTFRQAVLDDGFGVTEDEFQEFCGGYLSELNSYVFEYCSIKNRIVTLYNNPTMFLVSIINNDTGNEFSYEGDADFVLEVLHKLSYNIKHIGKYEFESLDHMVAHARQLGELSEGYVAKDKNGLRMKIKADLYLKVHKIKGEGQITPKSITSLVVENEQSEFLTYFPEYVDTFKPYEDAFNKLIRYIDNIWADKHGIESQKDFALEIKDYSFSAILFSMRKTEKSLDAIWETLRLDYKVDLLLGVMGNV